MHNNANICNYIQRIASIKGDNQKVENIYADFILSFPKGAKVGFVYEKYFLQIESTKTDRGATKAYGSKKKRIKMITWGREKGRRYFLK